jgi:hypothetical protein
MEMLRERFVWRVAYDRELGRSVSQKPEKPITHREFLEILKMMRDAIGDEDAPTAQDIERGRADYTKVIQDSSLENGMLESFGPRAYIPKGIRKKSASKRQLDEGTEVATAKRVKSNRLFKLRASQRRSEGSQLPEAASSSLGAQASPVKQSAGRKRSQ